MSDRIHARERWSLPGRRAAPEEVASRMTAFVMDAVPRLGADLSWRTAFDESSLGDRSIQRSLELVGARGEWELARASLELAVRADAERPALSGRIELVRAQPFVRIAIDTHAGEEHWDIEAHGLSEVTLEALRDVHARVMGEAAKVGGARHDAIEPPPVLIAEGDEGQLGDWQDDLRSIGLIHHREGHALIGERLALSSLDALFEARVRLGEVLAEAGEPAWEERALLLLAALT